MLRLAFDFIITWRETRTRPNAYLLLLKANESYLKFYASNNDSNPPNKENIPPKFPRLK